MSVVAVGPAEARFAPSAANGGHSAVLCLAGSYMLTATFGGMLAAGWPKPLEVKPAAGSTAKCTIRGDALNGVACGRTATLTLTSADSFGNQRCAGQKLGVRGCGD